jgi:hypothetical protein
MSDLVGRSIAWGAFYGLVAAFVTSLCLAASWSTGRTGQAGEFATLMILWVPPVAIMGGAAGGVLFGVVAVIMGLCTGRTSPLSYAVVGSILAFGAVILPFAAWVADGWLRALQGAQNTYALLPAGLLPVAIAGLLTGWKVQSKRS